MQRANGGGGGRKAGASSQISVGFFLSEISRMYPARKNSRLQLYENARCLSGLDTEDLTLPRSVVRCPGLNIHVQMWEFEKSTKEHEMCAEIMINYFFIKTKLVNWLQGEPDCCHGFVLSIPEGCSYCFRIDDWVTMCPQAPQPCFSFRDTEQECIYGPTNSEMEAGQWKWLRCPHWP